MAISQRMDITIAKGGKSHDRIVQAVSKILQCFNVQVKRMYRVFDDIWVLLKFACILKGDVKYLEKIKEHIITEYVNTGLIKLIRPTYDKKELYLLTHEEWDEYQTLKKKNSRLIGAGFP